LGEGAKGKKPQASAWRKIPRVWILALVTSKRMRRRQRNAWWGKKRAGDEIQHPKSAAAGNGAHMNGVESTAGTSGKLSMGGQEGKREMDAKITQNEELRKAMVPKIITGKLTDENSYFRIRASTE